ncbi:pantetheine-phosphate adenylyltransferase [candidate division LCP-89 bacterium B3_LCP]|uniref:Phosphopantetheine adenylyltransferase n=1 Tax=candidate division LCP-89 bacterium B3_LCP TaxID=2012998 RepID=A0A532V5B5_UNCL8|nr:MAG: pantetheine-phosphate adenylyltransferase [candidate division LCP-89 bacterium B3_LCP]
MKKAREDTLKIAIYPGSFDPITYGHLDVLERAATLFDRVIVAMAANSGKEPSLFTLKERHEMILEAISNLHNVEVMDAMGLMVDFAKEHDAIALIRGLRAISDFEYEFQMALMNRKLHPRVITVFLMPHDSYTYLNSTIVREVASFGGDISQFVPPGVAVRLTEKFSKSKG